MRIVSGLVVTASFVLGSGAIARPQFETAAPIAYAIDTASGAILFDRNSRQRIPPASMAKMMTAYVVFDLIDRGSIRPEQKFTVRPETWKKWSNTGSTMFLKPGEQVSVADLLHGVVTVSGNDAAIVLAEGISGSESGFVRAMNAHAQRLGMKDSHFGTANGWPDEGRTMTTARDLSLLAARTIQKFPQLYRQFYGLKEYRWNNVTQANRNPILGRISGADGLKTGHTDNAGYCFTGTAEQKGRRIIVVVAGLGTMEARARESIRLLQWGFDAWRAQPLFNSQSVVATLPVQLGEETHVQAIAPRKLALTLPATDAPRYKLFVRYAGPIKAPLRKGYRVATLVARFQDGSEQVMPLIAEQSVTKAGFVHRAWNGLKSLFGV